MATAVLSAGVGLGDTASKRLNRLSFRSGGLSPRGICFWLELWRCRQEADSYPPGSE